MLMDGAIPLGESLNQDIIISGEFTAALSSSASKRTA